MKTATKAIKKIIAVVLCIMMLCSTQAIGAFAATEYTSGNFTYTVSSGNATVVAYPETAKGEVEIPETLGGYPVIAIDDYAFFGCTVITSVKIPSGVKTIGEYAFAYCTSLLEIEIPVSVTKIGKNAFSTSNKLADIYYGGTEDDWEKISIEKGNTSLDNATLHYGDENEIFEEKSYIADIWLNQHDRVDDTVESKAINNLLGLNSISSDLYLQLLDDTAFQVATVGWNGLELIFDPEKGVEKVLDESDLYQSLIFNLLEKIAKGKDEEISNILLDAVDLAGEGAKYVTEYKGYIDKFVSLFGDSSDMLLDVLKEWRFNPKDCDSFNKFYACLNDTNDLTQKWSNNKFVKGVGTIAEATSDVAEFYKRFTGYCYAVNMADEMVILLKEMMTNTTDLSFAVALQDTINAFNNADYAAIMNTLEFEEDSSLTVTGALFDAVASGTPYGVLKVAYDVGTAFVNLTMNTAGIVDSYYLCRATYNFINANKASIESLADKYKVSGLEHDAGAYVYAVRAYEHAYSIDMEIALNLVKDASEEGLVNATKKLGRTIVNFITGNDELSSYEQMQKSKESIEKSNEKLMWSVNNSWKYVQDYLKIDFPEVYSVYVRGEITKDIYTPIIDSAIINTSGETEVYWSQPVVFYAENYDGKTTAYQLMGNVALDGMKFTEKVGTVSFSTISETFANPIITENVEEFETFNKHYSLSSFSETADGYVYTPSATKEISNPIRKVTLRIPTVRDTTYWGRDSFDALSIAIVDKSLSIYKNIVYKIYRQDEGSSTWRLIDTIERKPGVFNHDVTVYKDKTAVAGKVYSYKVSSYYEFGNGKTLTSDTSEELSLSGKNDWITEKPLSIRPDRELSGGGFRSLTRSSKSTHSASNAGLKIEWSEVVGASGYEVYRLSSYGSIYKLLDSVDGETLSYVDESVDNGITYEYVIVPIKTSEDGRDYYDVTTCAIGEYEYSLSGTTTSIALIEIASKPNDLYYHYKTDVSLDGLKVIAKYSDGREADITDEVTVSNFDTYSTGNRIATVEYEGHTAEFEYSVEYSWWQWILIIVLFGWIWY